MTKICLIRRADNFKLMECEEYRTQKIRIERMIIAILEKANKKNPYKSGSSVFYSINGMGKTGLEDREVIGIFSAG
jgi:hypothetical protein